MATQPVPIKHSTEIRIWLVLMRLFWEQIQKELNLKSNHHKSIFFHSIDRAMELKTDF